MGESNGQEPRLRGERGDDAGVEFGVDGVYPRAAPRVTTPRRSVVVDLVGDGRDLTARALHKL